MCNDLFLGDKVEKKTTETVLTFQIVYMEPYSSEF